MTEKREQILIETFLLLLISICIFILYNLIAHLGILISEKWPRKEMKMKYRTEMIVGSNVRIGFNVKSSLDHLWNEKDEIGIQHGWDGHLSFSACFTSDEAKLYIKELTKAINEFEQKDSK